MRRLTACLTLAASLFAAAAWGADAPRAPVDYTKDSSWLCRPGRQDACAGNLDAAAFNIQGQRTPKPFVAATDPKIDCFYVYPTVSKQPGLYADMTIDPGQTYVALAQAARFRAQCRVFAPMYRQLTLAAVNIVSKPGGPPADFDPPYADVLAAWTDYLARDNHGRGVVLIGHSQGAILLTRLIAEEIDAKPIAQQLVSAILPGDIGLLVPVGKDVGATFKAVPLCRAPTQTGCALAWNTYGEDDTTSPRFFGRSPVAGLEEACVNPAALAGGRGLLDAYIGKPPFLPASDPPWIEAVGELSAQCVADKDGNVLRVHVEAGPSAALMRTYLTKVTLKDGWGLHIVDETLPQGNLIDLVGTQAAAWVAGRKP